MCVCVQGVVCVFKIVLVAVVQVWFTVIITKQ